MTGSKIYSSLNVFLLMLALALFTLNCHTSKNHDKTEHKEKEEKEHEKEPKENDKDNHVLGETIELKMGEEVSIGSESLEIRIQEVKEDSRCPLNMQCFQAGKAKVELMMVKELDMVSSVNLVAKGGCQKMDGSCGNSAIAQDYKFTLIALTPYPGENGKNKVPTDKYVAHVKVEAVR